MFTFNKEKHYYELGGKRLYGITNVLGVIAKSALIQWSANEAIKYIKENSSGFQEFEGRQTGFYGGIDDGLLEKARFAHRAKKEDAADKGHDIHSEIETLVLEAIQANQGYIQGTSDNPQIQHFIDWAVNNKIKFLESEKKTYSEKYWVAGTIDLVFEKDGKTYIGDIKTYAKIWDRVPFLQCAGYGLMLSEQGQEISGYCVLLLTKDGRFEEAWSYDVEGDKQGFLGALTLFKQLETFKVKK